jgi:hypothetical protein
MRGREYREIYWRKGKLVGDVETLETREIAISHSLLNYTL